MWRSIATPFAVLYLPLFFSFGVGDVWRKGMLRLEIRKNSPSETVRSSPSPFQEMPITL